VDLSLFDNEYWDLIEAHLDLIRGQIQFRNIARARIRGIELMTQIAPEFRFRNLRIIPGLKCSLTLMDHQDMEWGDPLVYRPRQLLTLETSIRLGALLFKVDYRYASKIDAVKLYPINDRVPMKFLDIHLSWDLWKITIQAGIKNLLQYNYAPMESNLMPMRSFTVGLRGAF
jgi:outer membrane cobalamin receptor